MSWLPCHVFPISVVLSQLPCPSVMFRPSCPLFLVLPVAPQVPSLGVLSWLSCPSIVVPGRFRLLCCICCHGLIVLSYLFWYTCPVLGVLFWKSYIDCPVLTVQGRPYKADQKWKNWWTNDRKNSFSRYLKISEEYSLIKKINILHFVTKIKQNFLLFS